MDIKSIIENALDIPVIELSDPILSPCATWYQLYQSSELSGNATVTEESETYDIDIWCETREDSESYAGLLKASLLNTKYITYPVLTFSFDTNGKMWRANFNFKHIKED
nr:MAG TPA: hypothetical protein [Caudoviricetes sp.]